MSIPHPTTGRQDGPFTLQVSLSGMAPEDYIRLELPPECRRLSLLGLLDRVFPASDTERREIESQFDVRANPDLPEIYAVFLEACDEWRDWRCALLVSTETGANVELGDPVSGLLGPGPDPPLLSLSLKQRYFALEYALRQGLWDERKELLEWLRSLTVLYFLDKHEVRLDASPPPETAPAFTDVLDVLQSQGLLAPQDSKPAPHTNALPGGPAPWSITREGRRFIGGLLAETESCIALYDHYKDTAIDLDQDSVEFGTGRGIDLRVEAFLAEGIDPIRAVFLLRLYDGSLDARLTDWQDAIENEVFYERILEPVVGRYSADPAVMERVIEGGYAWLEEQQEQARRMEAQQEILRRAGGESPAP